MSPEVEIKAGQNPKQAMFGNAPSLAIMRQTYGANFTTAWLIAIISDFIQYANKKDFISASAVEFIAEAIMANHFYLKASEILLFFFKLKSGEYGKFYGNIDPMQIMMALSQFCQERNKAIIKKEEEDERKRKEEANAVKCLSPQDFCITHNLPEMDSYMKIFAYVIENKIDLNEQFLG